MGLKLYGSTTRSHRIAAAARFAGVKDETLEQAECVMGTTNKSAAYLKEKNPFGKVPCVENVERGSAAFESNAIARYLASTGATGGSIYPNDAWTRARIDGWMDSFNVVDVCGPQWLYPIVGIGAARGIVYDEKKESEAKKIVAGFMAAVEAYLSAHDAVFLVDNALSLADIVGASGLSNVYCYLVPRSEWQANYPKLLRWIETVYATQEWLESVGTMPVCEQAATYDPSGPKELPRPVKYVEEWPSSRVRDTFVNYFIQKQGHVNWPSSPAVPVDDPTLLFANAGMNQYKPIFLGKADPKTALAKLTRATNTQKCIRAGGKHNDLDDVGKDTYHHTFFEMLGNWSFGDYFKEEAIGMAWDLLTNVYGLAPDRLYATYFGGDESQGLQPDLEAKAIWLKYLPESRVMPFGCADNFWEMGDVGPCGPCTEIHYDRIGGRDAASLVNMDDPNCLEIWNVVFIQYNREEGGVLKSLPSKHVDTGMGFERLTSILQNKMSNYDTDVFMPIFKEIQRISGAAPYTGLLGKEDVGEKDMAYRVVADHIRTLSIAIADGAAPGSDGRNYVLRRVLRRAVRFGREKLGAKQGFFHKLVPCLIQQLGAVFPELVAKQTHITEIIADEEESFGRTLQKGIDQFGKVLAAAKQEGRTVISGPEAFLLWESYGFPNDLTELMAEENGFTLDNEGFAQAFAEAQEKSRAGGKKSGGVQLLFEAEATAWLQNNGVAITKDEEKYASGRPTLESTVTAIMSPSGFIKSTSDAEGPYGFFMDATTFYAESGGQVCDSGLITTPSGSMSVSDVKVAAAYVMHTGDVSGTVSVGDAAKCAVDYDRRDNIMPNHTMTHVLNYALRKVMGDGVDQKGSLVDEEKLRFDFSHNKGATTKQIAEIEAIVNEQIKSKLAVDKREVALDKAMTINGLRAVFGEVYPDPVRVVSVGPSIDDLLANPSDDKWKNYSIEFCGGTHLASTDFAEQFVILEESGIAKGIRRITGATREGAKAALARAADVLALVKSCDSLSGEALDKQLGVLKNVVDTEVLPVIQREEIRAAVTSQVKRVLDAQKEAAAAAKAQAIVDVQEKTAATKSAGAKYFVATLADGTDAGAMKEAAAVAFAEGIACTLLANCKGKEFVYCSVPPDVGIDVKGWLAASCGPLGGKGGGGKGGLAQGQGPNVDAVPDAVAAAEAFAKLAI